MTHRLGILASHPIQYHAPLFRELAQRMDLKVYFSHVQSAADQAAAGFNVAFDWDNDLLSGYESQFLHNVSRRPNVGTFFGCDTPSIVERIRQDRFDAFLVTGWHLKSYWQAIRACRRYQIPLLVRGDSQLGTPRGALTRRGKELIYPHVMRQFDAFLYVGRRNKAYLQHYGVPADRLFFSPHCVDNNAFAVLAGTVEKLVNRRSEGISPDQKIVLFVGKLLERKRPMDFILALNTLRGKGVDVCGVIAGDGPLRDSLEAKGRELRVPLVFLGFRNQTELPQTYAMADAMVLPSNSTETWGLVVNESLACGTPVVVSNAVGCAPDLVIEGRTGAVFPVGDVSALANAVQTVLETPPTSQAMHDAINGYSVSAAADGIVAAVEWLVVGRGS